MSTEPQGDPIGDFQRWLMRAGARSIGRDVAGRVRSTFGGGTSAKPADVWETATTEDPPEGPPECEWCPICRAARRYRDSGATNPNLSNQFFGVSDTLAGLTRDAFSLFDTAMKASQRLPAPRPSAGSPQPSGGHAHSDDSAVVVGPGVGWPAVVHPQDEHDEPADEGSHREEGREPGDGGTGGGADEQVERPAE